MLQRQGVSIELTIGIPTYLREEILVRTVERILEIMDPACMEVLVADQTPAHSSLVEGRLGELAREGRIRWERLAQPSLPGARNHILRNARGRIVVFLDDDVLLPPHLFRAHLAAYADGSIGAVTGQVYNALDWNNPPGLEDPAERSRPHSVVTEERDANNISGGNHSVRVEAARAVGGFDEQFMASAMGEDLDFARRLMAAGVRIRYVPEAWIIHLACPSGGCGISGTKIWPEWTHSANLCLYAFRHGFRQKNFASIFWQALRSGPLRKEVLVRPWRWPMSWLGFCKAIAYGVTRRGLVRGVRG